MGALILLVLQSSVEPFFWFTKAQAKASVDAATAEEGQARGVWDIVNGITAYAGPTTGVSRVHHPGLWPCAAVPSQDKKSAPCVARRNDRVSDS
jgi:hypothetical protein